ncbi:hypothetical protein FRC09_006235 [Ceratobasidium sp. 395]|nr:hypothetical protein FRC09_006235 [Ceratobasidium sp. 395]
MARLKVLRLRAAQNNLSYSSDISVSVRKGSRKTKTTKTTHLERCVYCLNIVPTTSTLQRHIAATPECSQAEQAAMRSRRRKRAAQREQEQSKATQEEPCGDKGPGPELEPEPEPVSEPEPEGQAQRAEGSRTAERAHRSEAPRWEGQINAPGTAVEGAEARAESSRRHRVTVEEVPDRDGSPPPAESSKRHRVTVEEVPDRDGSPPPVEPSAPPTPAQNKSREPEQPTRIRINGQQPNRRVRRALRRWKGLFVEDFPDPDAGAPISNERIPEVDLAAYMKSCGDLADPKHFEVAELLMTSGMTDEAKERHLRSTLYSGNTPWQNVDQMHDDIDKLRHGPEFALYDINVTVKGKARPQFMVSRHIVQVLRDIFANPAHKKNFKAAPERHYLSRRKDQRVYSDANSANWWWRAQERMRGKGKVTIAPLIIATDQTTLSIMCGGQKVYPVYVTPANITKSTRRKPSKRAMALLGYLPVDAFEDVEDDEERRRLKADLVHRSLEIMLAPLKEASENGVDMWCPDRRLRRVYPMVAAYTADWPEQNLQSCTSEGSCPVCSTDWADRGSNEDPAPMRDREETIDAILSYFLYKHRGALNDLHLKPVWPWWGDLPDVNLAECFTPDLLHQLYQGVFKTHVVRWLKHFVGADLLDERFRAMPISAGMRHFSKGITGVHQWTGRESKQMVSQILPVIAGELSVDMSRLIRAVIDFVFRAHASSMTDKDIDELEEDLRVFHELKGLLVEKGFYQSETRFNRIPKIHMLSHYAHFIREMGTPDGYNTEAPEQLHIEFAKVPWRASNKVRPLPQMLKYIQRQEAVRIHRAYLDRYMDMLFGEADEPNEEEEEEWQDDQEEPTAEIGETIGESDELDVTGVEGVRAEGNEDSDSDEMPVSYPNPRRHMAVEPTRKKLEIRDVAAKYGAPDLKLAIGSFMTNRLGVPEHDLQLADRLQINVWHSLYLYHDAPAFAPFDPPRRQVVRAGALVLSHSPRARKEPVWDTALFREMPNGLGRYAAAPGEEKHGIQRYRAGHVRALFKLPGNLQRYYSGHLAYLEVFKAFDTNLSPFTKLHSTQPDFDSRNRRRVVVIPATDIVMACHLPPIFHRLDSELPLSAGMDLFAIIHATLVASTTKAA